MSVLASFQFEAISHFDADERTVVKAVLESLIIRHDAGRWSKGRVKTG